jgi:transcriptional regulator with XRE-family HTH domain
MALLQEAPRTFGEALRTIRQQRGFTRRQVARQAGCAERVIEKVEDGKAPLQPVQIKRVVGMLRQLDHYKDLPMMPPAPPPMRPADPEADEPEPTTKRKRVSSVGRLLWATRLWREDLNIPINGDDGMLAQMQAQFGEGAPLTDLQNLRNNIRHELARKAREESRDKPLGASIQDRIAPPPTPMPPPARVMSKPPPAPPPPPSEDPMPMKDRTFQGTLRRREVFSRILETYADLPLVKLQRMLRERTGAQMDHYAASKMWKEARAKSGLPLGSHVKDETEMVGLENRRRRLGLPPLEPEATPSIEPGPEPPMAPMRTSVEQQLLAAVQLLREAVPGIQTLTIGDDGSIDYTMSETVVRSGRLKL